VTDRVLLPSLVDGSWPPDTVLATHALDQPKLRRTLHCVKAVLVDPSKDGDESVAVWPSELIERIADRVVQKLKEQG
jgi:hypothetical protein